MSSPLPFSVSLEDTVDTNNFFPNLFFFFFSFLGIFSRQEWHSSLISPHFTEQQNVMWSLSGGKQAQFHESRHGFPEASQHRCPRGVPVGEICFSFFCVTISEHILRIFLGHIFLNLWHCFYNFLLNHGCWHHGNLSLFIVRLHITCLSTCLLRSNNPHIFTHFRFFLLILCSSCCAFSQSFFFFVFSLFMNGKIHHMGGADSVMDTMGSISVLADWSGDQLTG